MTADARARIRRTEEELLGRLGLDRGANPLAIETARDAIIGFLSTAPAELRTWSARQVALTDEAYALLADPTLDPASLDAAAVAAEAVTAPVRHGIPTAPVATRRRGLAGLGPVGKAVASAIGVAAIVGVVYGVYQMGQPAVPGMNGSAAPEASASAGVDPEQVAALMQRISADPSDGASYQELADLYFGANDYANAITFEQKVVELDPTDVTAHIALGAAYFNSGDRAGAEKEWRAALALDAENVEAHYDLGYLYLSAETPDMAKVKAEWEKVIELAPGSDVAENVKTHLASLLSASTGDAPASATSGN